MISLFKTKHDIGDIIHDNVELFLRRKFYELVEYSVENAAQKMLIKHVIFKDLEEQKL